jgi:hypothetical protein
MRFDVVNDGRRRDAAGFQAKPTQWLDVQLMTASALPASDAVPAMNFRTMRHRGKGRALLEDKLAGTIQSITSPDASLAALMSCRASIPASLDTSTFSLAHSRSAASNAS